MALDAAFVIRTGSGALWILLGVAILALGNRRRENVALGVLALCFGSMFVANNFAFEAGANALAVTWGSAVLAAGVGGAAFAVGWTTPDVPRWPVVTAGAVAIVWQIFVPMGPVNAAVNLARFEPAAAAFFTNVAGPAFAVAWSLVLGLLAGVALAQRTLPVGDPRRRARRLLIFCFGLYVAHSMGANVVAYDLSGYFVLLPLVLALAVALLVAAGAPDGRGERDAALVILAAGLAGAVGERLMGGFSSGLILFDASPGILRIVGAALLAYAIFQRDLLGVPLPRIAERRGSVAMGALASLFIVAQIAQNYLSATYGLLMGGVVAGALLFAANPIQRAFERAHEPKPRSSSPAANPRAEESYRKALRIALKDRRLTREEETHLHELARDLGIDGPRAHALLAEAEAEARGAEG